MKLPKLGTDTKVIIAGVLVLGVGAWYVQRQARAAANGLIEGFGAGFDSIYSSLADGIGGAVDSVAASGHSLANYMGVQGTLDPVTGQTVPYGAVVNPPPGQTYNVPWYLGSGMSPVFNADGSYTGPGVWGSTSTRQAEQADVRRLDNAIADGSYRAPSPWSFLTLNMAG